MRANRAHVTSLIAHVYMKGFITMHTAETKKQEDYISYKFTLVHGASLEVPRGDCISFDILIPA